MDESIRRLVAEAFDSLSSGCKCLPATQDKLDAFETEFKTIPTDFRWFLVRCGGGTVGSEWVDGIDELVASHRKHKTESSHQDGWKQTDIFIIGWDGGGNPYGIHNASGKVLVEDHDFGGVHEMASSFQSFLEHGLLADD